MQKSQLRKANKQTGTTAASTKTKTRSTEKKNKKKKKKKQIKKKKKKKKKNSRHFSEGFFASICCVSISKMYVASTVHLCYGMMFFIMCHFYVKAIVFIGFVKLIPFSILFTFQISTIRLFKFMNFLWTCALIT